MAAGDLGQRTACLQPVERVGADDLQAHFELVRWLVAEPDPDDVRAVAEPGPRGDLGPLPRQMGMEAVDLAGPEGARVELRAAERSRIGAQPVQPAGMRLDPAFDDAAERSNWSIRFSMRSIRRS